jgi:hypothetical protein
LRSAQRAVDSDGGSAALAEVTTRYTANGVRYVIEHRELHARTVDERSAAIKPDKGLLSKAELAALQTIKPDYPSDTRRRRHKRKFRK